MIKTTYFKKFTGGKSIKMNGTPKRINVFDTKAADADYIEICTFSGYHTETIVLVKNKEGVWRSPLWRTGDGYMCYELQPKQTNYALTRVRVEEKEGRVIIAAAVPDLLKEAESAIAWCDLKDKTDTDGRYWLSAYRGAGVYRLIVAGGKIRGAIYGGFHDCRRGRCGHVAGDLVFTEAIYKVVVNRLGTKDFQMLKADGSGTYFYLRNQEDAIYLDTKEYDVPSATGGLHHNIEVK